MLDQWELSVLAVGPDCGCRFALTDTSIILSSSLRAVLDFTGRQRRRALRMWSAGSRAVALEHAVP